jgi:hypothetical protein
MPSLFASLPPALDTDPERQATPDSDALLQRCSSAITLQFVACSLVKQFFLRCMNGTPLYNHLKTWPRINSFPHSGLSQAPMSIHFPDHPGSKIALASPGAVLFKWIILNCHYNAIADSFILMGLLLPEIPHHGGVRRRRSACATPPLVGSQVFASIASCLAGG